jgi:hypothetical protein
MAEGLCARRQIVVRGNSMNETKGVLSNIMNWDPVAWMSVLMVVIAIVIVIFLAFKVKALMNKDAEAHKGRD